VEQVDLSGLSEAELMQRLEDIKAEIAGSERMDDDEA
jgi:hypothetical protein